MARTMATKRETILVVEDEDDILEVIRYNLAREGFRVTGVRDGEEGLARVRTDNPNLVLLDLMLPGIDGLEICRRLKDDPVTRAIPIVMVTAKGARIERGALVVDIARHQARVDGESITLTATEMRLLHFLAAHPGRVFTRDHLLSRVIGEHAVVVDRNIDVHIGSVRRKLGDHRDLIETIRGVGYRFRE